MSNLRGRASMSGPGQKSFSQSGVGGGGGGVNSGNGGTGANSVGGGSGNRMSRGGGGRTSNGPIAGSPGMRWGGISGQQGAGQVSSSTSNSQHSSPLPNHRGGGSRNNNQSGAHHQQHHQSQQPVSAGFPSLNSPTAVNGANDVMRDRMLFLLVSLVGFPVLASTRSQKFAGILSSASTEGGELGIVLSAAQEILPAKSADANSAEPQPALGALKKTLIIRGKDLDEIVAADVRLGDAESEIRVAKERQGFRTDTEISSMDMFGPGSERTLQRWADDPSLAPIGRSSSLAHDSGGGLEDGGGNEPWDQFKANEAKFALKSDYEETLYTTKLDKSGGDFKERERKAAQIAKEIMSTSSSNPHIAEERGQVDHSRRDEEELYGSVVRTPGKYVPPGARRAGDAASGAMTANGTGVKATVKSPLAIPPNFKSSESPEPAAVTAKVESLKDGPKSLVPPSPEYLLAMRNFASQEKEKLDAQRLALNKKEKETKFADLRGWHADFSLKTPVPADVASLSPKNLDKPRDPNLQKSLSPTAAHMAAANQPLESVTTAKKANEAPSERRVGGAASIAGSLHAPPSSGNVARSSTASRLAESKAIIASMTIPKIPPFDPERAKARQAALAAGTDSKGATVSMSAKRDERKQAAEPVTSGKITASASAFKMSAKASSFKPFNPNATSFTPGGSIPSAAPAVAPRLSKVAESTAPDSTPATTHVAAAAAAAAAAVPSNPFFGTTVPKKLAVSHVPFRIRDDFDPFKGSAIVPDASTITTAWEFSGKPYRTHFNAHPVSFLAGPSGIPQPFDDGSSTNTFQQGLIMGAGVQHVGPHAMHIPGPPSGAPTPTLSAHIPGQTHPTGQQFMPFQPYGGQYYRGPPSQQGGPPTPAQQHLSIPGAPHLASGPQSHVPHHGQSPSQSGIVPVPGPAGAAQQQVQGSHPIPHLMPQIGLPVHPSMQYANLPPQFMGGMPYAGPMPPQGGPPGTMYSPSMANMAPPGPGRPHNPQGGGPPFVPSGPAGGNVMRPGPGGPSNLQHMHKVPQHMYYQPGPMPMQYPPHFMNPNMRPGMPMDPNSSFGSPVAGGAAGSQQQQQQQQQQPGSQGQSGGSNGAGDSH